MQKLFILLLLIPFWCNSQNAQQVVELCADSQTSFIYTSSVNTLGTYTWMIDGIPVSNIDDFMVDWALMGVGTYTLETQFDNSSCSSESVFYVVNVVECPDNSIYAPNAFTPDGNQLNNVWRPISYNCYDVHYMIYNRWGEMVFESYDPNTGWDGSYKSQLCQTDVYVYVLEWRDNYDRYHRECGHITLLIPY